MTTTDCILTEDLRATLLEAIAEEVRITDGAPDDMSDGDVLAASDYWGPVYDAVRDFPAGPVVLTDRDRDLLDEGVEEYLSPAGMVILTVEYFIGHFPGCN